MRYGGGQRGRGGADRCPVELEQTPRRSCFWVYIRRSLSRRRAWRSSGPAAGPRHQAQGGIGPRLIQGVQEAGKEGLSLCLGEFRPQQDELVPADRKGLEPGRAEGQQLPGGPLEQGVPGQMPLAVIDPFETVEVQKCQAHGAAGALQPLQGVLKGPAVGQAGEGVGKGQTAVVRLFLQPDRASSSWRSSVRRRRASTPAARRKSSTESRKRAVITGATFVSEYAKRGYWVISAIIIP